MLTIMTVSNFWLNFHFSLPMSPIAPLCVLTFLVGWIQQGKRDG